MCIALVKMAAGSGLGTRLPVYSMECDLSLGFPLAGLSYKRCP